MNILYYVLKKIWYSLGILLLICSAYYAEEQYKKKTISSVLVSVINQSNSNDYLNKILENKISASKIKIIGTKSNLFFTKKINDILIDSPLVKNVIAYKTWKGALKIKVFAKEPIARIIYENGLHKYVDEHGNLFPTSKSYPFRVVIVKLKNFQGKTLQNHIGDYDAKLLKLLNYIYKNQFWRSHITYVRVYEKGNIDMSTQISKQNIKFGQPIDLETKFKKLKTFYTKITQKKGWNTYKSINVQFDKQIVCE